MRKTSTKLADGRELIYYDSAPAPARDAVDTRELPPVQSATELRLDPLRDEWVAVASHRQERPYHPPTDECPLCPSRDGRLTEIPDQDYQVVVFENRFPSLAQPGTDGPAPAEPVPGPDGSPAAVPLELSRPGAGRCEVVCFTPDHDASFADLTPEQARTVLDAWTDRTRELSELPGVEQVFCFENRGPEIGVTLGHPHGQIYAYPFTTPRTARMLTAAAEHRHRTGRNLFDDVVAAERADGARVVTAGEHWTAFVPFAARWPYEVHLYPNRRVTDLTRLDEAQRAEFGPVYLDLLRRFDLLFPEPDGSPGRTPYIAAWHQAPSPDGPGTSAGSELALHLELFSIRRTAHKLKYLAGSESGMDVFISDVPPETAAARLREARP